MKSLKWILWGVGALIVLVGAVAAYVAATFDPNDYTPRIVDLVKQRTGRTLAIDGKIRLAFFPKIGADIGQVTLSEPNGARPFARVESARVAVAVWPLLSKRVIVDRVTLKGLTADLVRYKDGRTNFDDLTGTSSPPATPKQPSGGPPAFAVDVGGVTIENASIGWCDERDGTNVRLSNLSLETDRLASGVPGKLKLASRIEGVQPRANLQLGVETGYTLDFATQAVALSALDVKAVGDAPGASGLDARFRGQTVEVDPRASRITLSRVDVAAKSKDGLDAKIAIPRLQLTPDQATSETITGDVKLATPERAVAAKLDISPLTATGKQVHASRVHVDLAAKQADLAVQGAVASPMTLDLERRQAQLPGLAGELTVSGPNIPDRSMKAALTGAARADWGAQNANATLAVKADESNIDTSVSVTQWSQPAITFDIVADRLNVDRYLPASRSEAPPGDQARARGAGSAGHAQAEQPFDLSALKALNATGNVKIGALQVSNVKAQQVALRLRAAGGRLDVNPISANLYQGTLGGSVAVNANDNRFAVKQKLSRVSVGPLLRDAASKDLLEGRGDVVLDVTTAGTTVTALKNGLDGTAKLALRDGAIKGVDIAGTIRTAKAMLGSRRALEQQAHGGAKTDFTELTASFVIENGVAHNEDLRAKSPLLRVGGRGDIDIGESTIDYTAKASVVATATGQGGKRLSDVAGVTVPVRATGPLTNITYGVDVGSLATDVATDAVQRELGRRLGGKSDGLPEDGAGAISDTVRGLLGR